MERVEKKSNMILITETILIVISDYVDKRNTLSPWCLIHIQHLSSVLGLNMFNCMLSAFIAILFVEIWGIGFTCLIVKKVANKAKQKPLHTCSTAFFYAVNIWGHPQGWLTAWVSNDSINMIWLLHSLFWYIENMLT